MDKNGLLHLITRINTQEEGIADSRETVRWKALREAETLTDPELFPLLQEIVRENKGKAKAKRDVRMAAGFIYGRLMEQAFDPASWRGYHPHPDAGKGWPLPCAAQCDPCAEDLPRKGEPRGIENLSHTGR